MEQTGEYRVAAARDEVWRALNDPDVLARCIDGCQSFERVADDRFEAVVKARVGPVSATFKADVTLDELDPPNGYTLRANVSGGAAGFAKGDARVDLTSVSDAPEAQATLLRYRVQANVGGKLAQLGSRLIDGAARKRADDFFAAFQREVGSQPEAAEPPPEPAAPPGPTAAAPHPTPTTAPSDYQTGGQWKIWLVVFIALVVTLVLVI